MSEEFDVTYLVCAPVERGITVFEGSVKLACEDCKQEVWCAPSGQNLLASSEEPIVVICSSCARTRMQEHEEGTEIEISPAPGAVEEISAFLRQPPVP